MLVALKKFHQRNNSLPDMIIIYRDGVGDGQIRYVKEWEMRQIAEVMSQKMQGRQ